MDSNKWADLVTACQNGNTQYISQTIDNPPDRIRFNKLLKIALQYQQWNVVEQLLPLWDCTKSPRLFHFAPTVPLHVVQKAYEMLKGNAPPSHTRKDCISAVQACVVRRNPINLQYFIEQLGTMNVTSLHDPVLWRTVGHHPCAEIYTILMQNFNPDAATRAHIFSSAIDCNNWTVLGRLDPQSLHRQDFIDGLVHAVRLGKREIIAHYLPHITNQDLHHVIKKSVESCSAINRSTELNVWLSVLSDFTHLGPVVEDLLKCAIFSNNLGAVQRLAPYYNPQDLENCRSQHPLLWVVNNLAGSFSPEYSLEMLNELLPQYEADNPVLLRVAEVAVSRRGDVTLPHLDAMRAYSTLPALDLVAFRCAIIKTNTEAVKHLMLTISDADFLQAIADVKNSVPRLEQLSGWMQLEPVIQPRILQLALVGTHANSANKRKM